MSFDPIAIFGTIALVQFLGWLTPGPNLVAVASAAMSQGRRHGITTAAGIATGIILWASLAVAGIALVFQLWPPMFVAIKLAGGGYLVWLGIQSLLGAQHGGATKISFRTTNTNLRGAFLTGLAVIITNPKAPIFFGSILTAFLPVGAPMWILAAIVFEFFVLSLILNGFTALVFSTATMARVFERNQRTVGLLFGILFLALGAFVIYETVFK